MQRNPAYLMRISRLLILVLPLLLIACVYRPVIKQGNFITDKDIAKVKPGMTEPQVKYVLGPPMVKDPFHPNRWDYVYYMNPDNGAPKQKEHVIVMFKDSKVVSIKKVPMTLNGA